MLPAHLSRQGAPRPTGASVPGTPQPVRRARTNGFVPRGYNSRGNAFGSTPRCAMTEPSARDVLLKVRKLRQLAADLRQGRDFSSTRLTVLKSLCREQEVAARFAAYLARCIRQKVEEKAERPGYLSM